MKSLLLIMAICISLTSSTFAASKSGPLQIHAPSDWKVKYEDGNYILNPPAIEGYNLLFISRDPISDDPISISMFLDKFEALFQKNAAQDPRFKIKDTTRERFATKDISGEYVRFNMESAAVQVAFEFLVGQDRWEGQFTGSPQQWENVRKILKGIKRNG